MIKLNKSAHKRSSTYANLISVAIGAGMVYVPDLVEPVYVPVVMMICSVVVALCQSVTKNAK